MPKGIANARVVVKQVSDSEIRIRKANVIPEDESRFIRRNGNADFGS